ncbi:armadillo-type protein [Lipomyces japonicus]|uniref:armadillo-type protein n=1 Tax=Lipomyces japonicus TaxID=56871 RepID=UPI0034CEC34B
MVVLPNDDVSRQQRRSALHNLNSKAWEGQKNLFQTSKSLDSSLKKNTAFIKRLRTSINADSSNLFLKDISTLSLEKYLSEIISAASEGLGKCRQTSEIWAAVEVISALHQRFSTTFTPALILQLLRGFSGPTKDELSCLNAEQREKEDSSRLVKHRGLFRLLTEFWFCGIARTSEDAKAVADAVATRDNVQKTKKFKDIAESDPLPLEILKELLNTDHKDFFYLALVVSFIKNYGNEFLGLEQKRTERASFNEDGGENAEIVDSNKKEIADLQTLLVPPTVQRKFNKILELYYAALGRYLVSQHKLIKDQEKRNNAAYMRSGEIFEDRQANYDKMLKTEEKMIASAQVLADALGTELPELPEDDPKSSTVQLASFSFSRLSNNSDESESSIWDDDEQKKFYEDITDLRIRVPQEYFEFEKKNMTETEGESNNNNSIVETVFENNEALENIDDFDDHDDFLEDAQSIDDENENLKISNQSIGAQVDAIINRLPDMTTRELVDQIAYDFSFLNSNASRVRLLRSLQSVPKDRPDLIPFYAKLIATLGKYIQAISDPMIKYLQNQFRSLLRRRSGPAGADRHLSEARFRNIWYLSELVKFKIVPNHVVFNCIKLLLDSFGRSEIETLCNLLESCGKFLLRNENTHDTMKTMLDILWKKKSAQNLEARERVLIENAFYLVNPPERPAIVQKTRSVIEQYIRKLIYFDLNKRSYSQVLKQLRKLDWNDKHTCDVVDKVFEKVWKVRYGNVHLLALIASCLMRYHENFSMRLVDSVLEDIRVGLELNLFKYNQQRIAQVKYLGEMYNYKMVVSSVIFDTLYTIVGFGHEGNRPQPGKFVQLDPADDYFRIRLVCTLLETCGGYFSKGSANAKLNLFLSFFQYYVFTKLMPLPMDIEFAFHDLLQMLRPNLKTCSSIEEAAESLTDAMATTFGSLDINKDEDEEDESREVNYDDEIEEDDADVDVAYAAEDLSAHGASEESSNSDSDSDRFDSEYDEDDVQRGRRSDPLEDEEFDRELAKLLSEGLESRKSERRAALDVPLPLIRQQPQPAYSVIDLTNRDKDGDDNLTRDHHSQGPKNMQFRLLTKKGNRQLVHKVDVPVQSSIAVSTRMKQIEAEQERQRIKSYVLNYEKTT